MDGFVDAQVSVRQDIADVRVLAAKLMMEQVQPKEPRSLIPDRLRNNPRLRWDSIGAVLVPDRAVVAPVFRDFKVEVAVKQDGDLVECAESFLIGRLQVPDIDITRGVIQQIHQRRLLADS